MSELQMHIENWPIERLVPYELNSKIHDAAQVEKIANAIQATGWDQPIVVDKDGVIIKGHGRRLAAQRLNLRSVPVLVRADLSPEQVRVARLADNRVAVSGVDAEMLKRELESLDFDLDGIFDAKELKFLEVDLAQIDETGFVEDIDLAIDKQTQESIKQVLDTDARPVKVDKVLGFKTVQGSDERHISRFIAMIEGETGMTGADAFVEHAKRYYNAGGSL
jgi:ParB-like chromosome segregation protein Spo0J